MVSLTNRWVQAPLFDGQGNWGSLTDDRAAAYRYTETRLSKFADEILFNKFYMPIVDWVPTFDGTGTEPLILPALLPVVLINGQFGIATGATTHIPSFEYKSMLKCLRAIYEGAEIEPKLLYKTLKFRSVFGGEERELTSKEEKQERMQVFTTVKGRVTLWSNPVFDGKRTIIATKFAVNSMPIEKLEKIEGIAEVRDDSSKKDKYGTLTVLLKKNLTSKAIEKLVKRVDTELSASKTYNQNRTERYIDDVGQAAARVVPLSVTDLLKAWVKWRIELERRACSYWINEDDKEIRRLDLLAQAVDLIDFIVSLVKDAKLTEEQVYEKYSKKAKVTMDEAKYVLGRPIISLRKLEKKKLAEQREAVVKHKETLEKRKKKPEPFMAKQLEDFAKLVNTDDKEKK
jgi:DNA gyrase/topoisomerase IV subunit A